MFIQQIGQTEVFVYEDALFTSNDLVDKFDNTQKQSHTLDSESQQGFNKFLAKANYIVDQLTDRAQPITDVEKFIGKSQYAFDKVSNEVYQIVDVKNPTLLFLLIPFAGFVIIRSENEKIQFYDVQKFVAYIFIVILVSSAVVTPFSFSVFYWGYAFAQEPSEDIGPPDSPPADDVSFVQEFGDGTVIISSSTTNRDKIPLEEPPDNITDIATFNNETVLISSSTTTTTTEGSTNDTSSVTEFDEGVVIISSSTTSTTSIVNNFTNGYVTVPPNATESWQFENDTSDITLIGDASLYGNEGINGTSLLLDGDLDFAVTNSTNATTYITDMSIAAWVKPNYTKGSPEFTVVSKAKSFVLSINNLIEPQRVAKFEIFDGIKWTTIYSTSTIPELSWSHLTARFNKTAIEVYVNGTMEASIPHSGIPFVNEKGQIQLKTLQEITSYYDVVIGASITFDMNTPYNMFSGLIDSVQLFDNKLEQSDIANIFAQSIPTSTLVAQELLSLGIPLPFI